MAASQDVPLSEEKFADAEPLAPGASSSQPPPSSAISSQRFLYGRKDSVTCPFTPPWALQQPIDTVSGGYGMAAGPNVASHSYSGEAAHHLPKPGFYNPWPRRECRFCKKNGETPDVYRSHVLRDWMTGAPLCPILRQHVCEICHATGDNAHTRSYCPNRQSSDRMSGAPIPLQLKSTPRQSSGRLRR